MTKKERQDYVYSFLINEGLPLKTTCAIMGNITGENSGWETTLEEASGGGGYGLCQWTNTSSSSRRTQLENYVSSQSGNKSELECQCIFLWNELTGKATKNGDKASSFSTQWIANPADSVDNGQGFYCELDTFLDGDGTLDFLTDAFRFCWERPAYDYDSSWGSVVNRRTYAAEFYETYSNTTITATITKRSDSNPVSSSWPLSEPDNTYYGTGNPYHSSNYGMFTTSGSPRGNCTAYAWGRAWEIRNELLTGSRNNPKASSKPNISVSGSAHTWYTYATTNNTYPVDSTPRIGDVACWENTNTPGSGGHVAIVESIDKDTGNVVCSNSAWDRYADGLFFYMTTRKKSAGYDDRHYAFQGFIHILDDIDVSIDPGDSEITVTNYGVYIKGKFYKAQIYHQGYWVDATPTIYQNKKWNKCVK